MTHEGPQERVFSNRSLVHVLLEGEVAKKITTSLAFASLPSTNRNVKLR